MITKLGVWWKKNPGLVVSGGAHLLAFLCLVLNLNWWHAKLDDAVESVPVEMVTTSDFNQIMNGEKTAKQMDVAQRRVDQVAEVEEHKAAPPIPDSVKDTPPPPSPEKANTDPGQADKAEKANAPPPPPAERPQPVTPPPPAAAPMPPERPVEKTEAPTPPPKPDDVKPPPEEAEAIEQKPPPKPKVEKPKKEPKKVAKPKKTPVPKPRPVEVAEKEVPDPPRKPEPRPEPDKPSLPRRTFDQVAKLLDTLKPPKEEVKARAGNEAKEAKHSDFSLDKISALLDHEAPQRRASTGQKATRLASLGSPTAHADKMSPALMAQIDGWLIDHYRGCWSYFGLGAATDYVPKVHVQLGIDGSLTARPVLVNQPSDPNLRSLADSAVRAVNKCNPMPIPAWFKSHYEAWRDRTVRFDPKEMS